MSTPVSLRAFIRDPLQWLAFGFGAGLSPYAPGTWGTLVGVILYWPLALLTLQQYLLITLLAAVAGIGLCGYSARKLSVHDHPGIVWDEIVGFWVTMIAVPNEFIYILLGFVLFRLFDIWKPWPIRWLDKSVTGGLGIMLDDILAGGVACLLLHIIVLFW